MKVFTKFLTFALIASILTQTCFVKAETGIDTLGNVETVAISEKKYDEYITESNSEDYSGNEINTAIDGFTAETNSNATVGEHGGRTAVLMDGDTGELTWYFDVPKSANYQIKLEYMAFSNTENEIILSAKINGNNPFGEADNFRLPRLWKNETDITVDKFGNQITPKQIQQESYQSYSLKDADGLYLNPLKFSLDEGKNSITLQLYTGKIALTALSLEAVETYESYEKVSETYKNADEYEGKDIVIQGQNATYKSSKELRPISDKSDPAVTPSSAYNTMVNSIGGSNWDSAGEKITWEFDVPKDGLYVIAFNYRQSYLTNASSIRSLKIDDKTPFSEASEILFPYATEWEIKQFGEDEPYKVFLTKGKHTLSLEVSLGEIADITRELADIVYNVGELYRQIIMITGTSPDVNRDYRLSDQIPTLNEDLLKYKKQIDEIVVKYNSISGQKGGSNAVNLEALGRVLENMQKSKFDAHKYVKELFNNYSSASAWVYEMRKMPLDIEKIIISQDNNDYENYKSGFFEKLWFDFQKLMASFVVDYNNLSYSSSDKSIDVWVNVGRDQARVLSTMIEDSFTPKTGISVNVKLSTATMIQAMLSGDAPDCTIMQERTIPVNLAMRGALYDLSQFKDFDKVVKERYGRTNIITPYKYGDGVYGLPDTETFPLMYVRTDVFEQLGLTVPKTWEEFMRCAAVLMRNNLSVGIPQVGAGTLSMYTTFLYQFGGTMYKEDLSGTNLQTAEAYSAFEYFCDLYCEYKLPTEFSLYNRFRTGEMPLGIAPYTEYANLSAAAPEITGKWSVYSVPGMNIDGKINDTVVGSGTACIMLNDTEDPDSSWEFLKWWTDSETQYRYSSDIESIVGVAARHPSANVNTLGMLSWGKNDTSKIIEQYNNVEDLNEVPGGYYLTRALSNAFYSVYNDNEDPKKMLLKWSTMVDEEMERKIKEYSR